MNASNIVKEFVGLKTFTGVGYPQMLVCKYLGRYHLDDMDKSFKALTIGVMEPGYWLRSPPPTKRTGRVRVIQSIFAWLCQV